MDKFFCSVSDVVHALHPSYLVLRFQFFGNTLALCHLGHELIKHGFRLPINVGEIGVQPAARFQLQEECAAVLPDETQMPLPPDADGRRFLCGQAREIVVSPALVPQAVGFFINVLFHCEPSEKLIVIPGL